MLLLFPLIYAGSFFSALYSILKGKHEAVLKFIIFGLPIYITALSIAFMYGLQKWIPFLQAFKELIIIITLLSLVLGLKRSVRLLLFDWLVIGYVAYNFLYIALPIGIYNTYEKILAFKNISFFPFVYFVGRLIQLKRVNANESLYYISLLQVIATVVLVTEILQDRHLQTITGYADYIYHYFDVKPAGSYGLTMTFEADNGVKRFASIFANPLEFAAITLVTVCWLCSVILFEKPSKKLSAFMVGTIACALFSIIFALSRASLTSFFLVWYVCAYLTGRKLIIRLIHYGILAGIGALLMLKGNLIDYAIDTISFTNGSSVAHLISWVEGLQAIATHPMGLGLGSSGRVGAAFGLNVGGENEPIIIGVQSGVVTALLYIGLHIYAMYTATVLFKQTQGKAKKTALLVLLLKTALIIPLLTAEVESYAYVSYITWFFTGYLIQIKENTLIQQATL
jgi:hypothetical protein